MSLAFFAAWAEAGTLRVVDMRTDPISAHVRLPTRDTWGPIYTMRSNTEMRSLARSNTTQRSEWAHHAERCRAVRCRGPDTMSAITSVGAVTCSRAVFSHGALRAVWCVRHGGAALGLLTHHCGIADGIQHQ
jgi:hypothetical protein